MDAFLDILGWIWKGIAACILLAMMVAVAWGIDKASGNKKGGKF